MIAQAVGMKDRYLDTFSKAEKSLPGAGLGWLRDLRRRAAARFGELGFPTEKDEAWRFTPTAPIAEGSFTLGEKFAVPKLETLAGMALCPFEIHRLVFVNGRYSPELSFVPELPGGAVVMSLGEALTKRPDLLEPHLARLAGQDGQAFAALNTALFGDGALVHLPKGCVLEHPVQLVFVAGAGGSPSMSHSRVLIVADEDAKASVIEEYVSLGGGTSWTNMVTEASLGPNAAVEHYKLQREGDKALHVGVLQVGQDKDSGFTAHSVSLGGALVRNDVRVALDGDGAICALNGLYLVRGRQHVDNHTVIDHLKPHGTSRELYKGVLDGQARSVFSGTIDVRPDAQKTDARVYNKNLLLSEHCLADTKPEFRINANDVQCRHGASIGRLSEDALFYLRSRGIEAGEARRLLVHAFASEMVSPIPIAPLRDALSDALHARLPESGEGD